MESLLERAIEANRKRNKYRKVLKALRLKHFEHEDAGKGNKAAKLVRRCERIIKAR